MEILSIKKWIESRSGNDCGYDAVSCPAYGYSDGSGPGNDRGGGYGGGTCRGDGNFDGSGSGSGLGRTGCADISFFCGSPVYEIDRVQTIVTAVFGSYAKGYILGQCLTLTPCYIAKQESYFAHGKTLNEAVSAVAEKALANTPEEERISEFWKCHENGVKYPARDLYDWHHRLTGSCEMGRKAFMADRGIRIDDDMFTVDEFVKLCKNSYGGEIIRKLAEEVQV